MCRARQQGLADSRKLRRARRTCLGGGRGARSSTDEALLLFSLSLSRCALWLTDSRRACLGQGLKVEVTHRRRVSAPSLSLYALWLAESSILDNTACLGGGRGQAQTTHRRVGALSLGSLAGGVADSRGDVWGEVLRSGSAQTTHWSSLSLCLCALWLAESRRLCLGGGRGHAQTTRRCSPRI